MDNDENGNMEITDKFRPFRLSPITAALEKHLEGFEEGEVADYPGMRKLIGLECHSGGEGYCYLDSAMKRLAKRGHHFANIPAVGYRKLNPNETVQEKGRKHKNLGQQINRHSQELSTVDINRLGPVEKMEFGAVIVMGRLASRVLSGRAKTKLIEEIKRQPDPGQIDYEALSETYMRKKAAT